MLAHHYCFDCLKDGEFIPLKFVMVNISSGFWTCTKDECIFPMNSPLLESYMEDNLTTERVLLLTKKSSKSKKSSKRLSKRSLNSLKDGSSSSSSYSGCSSSNASVILEYQNNHLNLMKTISGDQNKLYPIWENEGLLCWLDSILTLLVFNRTLLEEMKKEEKVESIFSLIYLDYARILKAFRRSKNYRNIKGNLDSIRQCTLDFLQPKLLSNFGDEDSPFFALPFLVKTYKDLYQRMELEYQCHFHCDGCNFSKDDGFRKVIMTLATAKDDLNFNDNIYYERSCYRCNKENQIGKIHIEKFPMIFLVHFPQGVENNQYWVDFNFSTTTDEYIVTQIVQYVNRKHHFVVWCYNYKEKLWLEADDLKDYSTAYIHKYPKCSPHEVHLIVWEKKSVLEKNSTVEYVFSESTSPENLTPNEESKLSPGNSSDESTMKFNERKLFNFPRGDIPRFKPYVSKKRHVLNSNKLTNERSVDSKMFVEYLNNKKSFDRNNEKSKLVQQVPLFSSDGAKNGDVSKVLNSNDVNDNGETETYTDSDYMQLFSDITASLDQKLISSDHKFSTVVECKKEVDNIELLEIEDLI